MLSNRAAASAFIFMETVSPSRKSTFAPVVLVAVVLVLYVGSYCWLRFGMARVVTFRLNPAFHSVCLLNKRWKGIDGHLNFIFKPLLKADALISRERVIWFTSVVYDSSER